MLLNLFWIWDQSASQFYFPLFVLQSKLIKQICSHSVLISFSMTSHITTLICTAEALTNTMQHMEANSYNLIVAKLPGNWLVHNRQAPSLSTWLTQFHADVATCKLDNMSYSTLLRSVNILLAIWVFTQFRIFTHTSKFHWQQINHIHTYSSEQIFFTITSNNYIPAVTVYPHWTGMLTSKKETVPSICN